MAVVLPAPPALSGDLALFHTTDPLLANSPVLVYHGAAASIGATSSRIQVHVFTPAGLGSYARLAVSPNSPFYSAVNNLPREEQGDEVCRGLAFGLKKYFAELPESVKKTWCAQVKAPSPGMLFGDDHIAVLASRMTRIENVEEVTKAIEGAFAEQRQSWLDVDVVLPPGSIKETTKRIDSNETEDPSDHQSLHQMYGRYADLIASLGDIAFMPTSKLKRAPSRPTAVGRGASFLKHQKENVRRELCELVDTEESYVERLKELQDISANVGADLKTTSRQQLQSVFPGTIGSILYVNSSFLQALRTAFDDTESTALEDIEATTDNHVTAVQARQNILADTQGIVAIAKCMCERLPQFAEAYGPYLRSQAESSQLLRRLFRSSDTALIAQLQEIGEQKLSSLLIEPVQRLPRYSLYIDSLTKQLPVGHPGIKHLLRARDIVSEICAQDDSAADDAGVVEKLRSRVSAWPTDCLIAGRFVTAVDYTTLSTPYALSGCDAQQGILLLFTDGLLMLDKCGNGSLTARSLHTDLEGGSLALQPTATRPGTPHELRFSRRVQLNAFLCSEGRNGRTLQVFTQLELGIAARPAQQSTVDSCHVLRLEAAYDGKAGRFVEELTKARIEARFGEAEREGGKWEVRAANPAADHASLLSAVFEDSTPDHVANRRDCADIRILVDIDKHSQRPRAGQNGIRTVVAVSPLKEGLWRLTIDSVDGSASREHVAAADLVLLLSKRLATLSAARFTIEQPSMTGYLLAKHADILACIDLQIRPEEDDDEAQPGVRDRVRRPRSPRKLLSTFLASTGPGSQPPAFMKKDLPPLPPPVSVLRAPPSSMAPPQPPSRESRPSSKDQATPKSISSMRSTEQLRNPVKKLEETLSTYMIALQHRKGNIVGRSLKMRALADELAVNELYNNLLEDPNMMVLAAQAAVDVLFAAFEKFLNVAWKEHIGQIVPYTVFHDIQVKAETLFPIDFDEYFRSTMRTLPPQNQRAFKGIMKLLADLLDGTGNDADRGALTAAFAEVLVTESNPHDFIALIDRFVDDTDTYFGEPLEEGQRAGDGPGSIHKRARSVNSASISSNTSSLRKKFGFGTLSRTNSKSEEESKVASVWRTLSKSTRGDANSPANSLSKATLYRSQSTDIDGRLPRRPTSQEGPPTLKPSALEDVPSLGASSSTQNLGLSTIGEHPSFIPTGPPRKKRRSSLSDLKGLDSPQSSQSWMAPLVRRPPLLQRVTDEKSLPNSPTPSTPSSKGGSGRFGSPLRETPRSRLPASFRRENSPGANKTLSMIEPLRPRSGSKQPDEVVISPRPTSAIPMLAPPKTPLPRKASSPAPRFGLAERPGAGNIVKKPSPQPEKVGKSAIVTLPEPPASTKKLRMQSPQKLRERLQNEQGAITATQTSLQDELSKIGDELTATPSRIGSVRAPKMPTIRGAAGAGGPPSTTTTTMDLAQRVLKMEGQLVKQVDELKGRVDAVQADLSSSLTVSENKCKKLDELYREANGENEALYTRFNDELGRILKAVRAGEGVEELRRKLKESQEEAAKLKRESSRLKRENVGLRAQMRE
ncbi:hypothetical protein LTR36_004326 [Oleoguttula mirabilis]|uniref:DH domain-containing protein n=1 Tax=Oleoguttula mirabilis TaxID=1507867 RepID=A0AAV9JGY6_9PEZI|nr:hypothetical protein LTR36_004326 [Oleoguttula mirabilis]